MGGKVNKMKNCQTETVIFIECTEQLFIFFISKQAQQIGNLQGIWYVFTLLIIKFPRTDWFNSHEISCVDLGIS